MSSTERSAARLTGSALQRSGVREDQKWPTTPWSTGTGLAVVTVRLEVRTRRSWAVAHGLASAGPNEVVATTLTPAACSASPTVLPQEVAGRDTPLTPSMEPDVA